MLGCNALMPAPRGDQDIPRVGAKVLGKSGLDLRMEWLDFLEWVPRYLPQIPVCFWTLLWAVRYVPHLVFMRQYNAHPDARAIGLHGALELFRKSLGRICPCIVVLFHVLTRA